MPRRAARPGGGGPYEGGGWRPVARGEPPGGARLAGWLAGADAVVHLAWQIQPSHDRARLRRTNVTGTANLLDAMRAADPLFVLAMGIVAALGNTVTNIVIATAIINFPLYARVARAEANVRRDMGFVQAARLSGNGEFRILLVHILPNIMAPNMLRGCSNWR